MIIGITGSSGSGKSTVCEMLRAKYGATIINADMIAKYLAQKGMDYYNDIVREFGKDILLENEELNRKKLAQIIYNDNDKRNILNNITFKYVRKEIKKYIEKINNSINEFSTTIHYKTLIIIDAPLLFEAGLEDLCDKTISVISESKLQIERIIKRDNITKAQAVERLGAQKENEYYKTKSDYVIINNEKLDDLYKQVNNFIKSIEVD